MKAGGQPIKAFAPEMILSYPDGMDKRLEYSRYDSPLGALFVSSGPSGLTCLSIAVDEGEFLSGLASKDGLSARRDNSCFSALFRMLDEYFSGRPVTFDLPLDPAGTDFDRSVWKALSSIPWGKKMSYGEVSYLIGSPRATRAVGGACGRNPIPIIIPCHRVLQAGGLIGGYSGGEGVKEKLLSLEGIPFKIR